jgi:hypothetical protein
MNQATGHGSAPGADGVRQALKVPESGLVSDPAQELISPTLETPETVLMQMARDALRALNQLVQTLIEVNPETFGTTEQGKTFKEHIINVAAECTLSRDSVDANISGRCVFNLMQFVNQLPTIHASENVALATVGQFLGQVVAGLHDSKTANLEKLNASQRRAVEAVEACLMHLKDNDLPPGYHGPRTALYRKLFGTKEGRKAQATTCRELGSRLAKQASGSELTKDVDELCRDAYAALYAVDSSVTQQRRLQKCAKEGTLYLRQTTKSWISRVPTRRDHRYEHKSVYCCSCGG